MEGMKKGSLERLFNPKTIAVVGASSQRGSVGRALMENLAHGGFRGEVFPVNPNREKAVGCKCFSSIKEIPRKVDLAVIATPAEIVPGIVEQCGQAKVGGAVIISSGFKEAGEGGKKLDSKLSEIIDKYPLRVIGPNCLGFIRPSLSLNTTFTKIRVNPGRIAFVSQSGALGSAALDWAGEQGLGFSWFVSVGEMIDVGFYELIDYLRKDRQVSSLLLYVETVNDGREFIQAAQAFAREKPIVVLKAGKSKQGARAALSHTGSLTGDDQVFDAVCEKAGVLRVQDIQELFDCAEALAFQSLPRRSGLAIVTNAGGGAVVATDALMKNEGRLARLSSKTQEGLKAFLPVNASLNNPVDILGDATPDLYEKTIDICLKDNQVGGLLVIVTPQAMTDTLGTAKAILKVARETQKTLLVSLVGGKGVAEAGGVLQKNGVPVFEFPEKAVRTFTYLHRCFENRKPFFSKQTSTCPLESKGKKGEELIKSALSQERFILTEQEAKQLVRKYEIAVPKGGLAGDPDKAIEIARRVGFPVVLKICSAKIFHKTDFKGVCLGLNSDEEVRRAFKEVTAVVKKSFPKTGKIAVLVEKMIKKPYELFLGSKKDPIFGPVIVFGRGGVTVEVERDVAFALPPLTSFEARRLIEKTRVSRILKGCRGREKANLEVIVETLCRLSQLVCDFPQIKAIDINPFVVDCRSGIALDAKVVLEKE